MAGRKAGSGPAEGKDLILQALAEGRTVAEACTFADRSYSTYEKYRREDSGFAAAVDRLVNLRRRGVDRAVVPDFPEFSERYLGARVFPHMLNVVDVLEGRDPGWRHPAMVWEPGESDLAIVNMPPEHGKSTTITMNYVTWRINRDPNVRVLIVSKTQQMAQKFLYGVKQRLTHSRFREMHAAFGPIGGWDKDSESWNQTRIYVSPEATDAGEKDPTVEALGIRGHIYGARADLIILDDCVDGTNAHDYEKQIDWIQGEVLSRISSSGMCLVVGTRLAPNDLYKELREPSRYPDEVSPWTYLSMPAVLEYADDPKDWVTLWPRSNTPEIGAKGKDAQPDADGLFPKWNGPRLFKKRGRMQPRSWALLYQQQQILEDSIFHPDAIKGVINPNRRTGRIPDIHGNRKGGMSGLLVVAGLDPAMAGFTAAVVIGLDPRTQKRYVLDVSNRAGMKPDDIRDLIRDWTTRYGISEWRIEKNAFQAMLTQDREVKDFLASQGCILREHFTGVNKWDADFGVASMTMLFQGWDEKRALIELPSTTNSEPLKALIEQLITWVPDAPKTQKTDTVMALWFAELACRDRVQAFTAFGKHHLRNNYLTRADKQQRRVVNLMDAEVDSLWQPIT